MPDLARRKWGWHMERLDRFKRSRAKERRTRKSMTEAWRVKDGLATVKWWVTPGRKQDGEKQFWWRRKPNGNRGMRTRDAERTAPDGDKRENPSNSLCFPLPFLWPESVRLPQIITIWVVFTIFVLVRSPRKGSPALVQCVWGRSGVTVSGTNGRTSAAKQ